ncbi:MAG TPA: isoprenylcysteine carboxylmethyltransferase family protein, partial [Candidatus Dormibacteraeota bacterium]|nr:isoprenylcysteine carboxylmethyltransferase family protein [Candidatus Dormibacteraeota bacterium]
SAAAPPAAIQDDMAHGPDWYRHLISWPWLAWLVYWLGSAVATKTTQRRESRGSRLAHVVPLLIGAALLGWPSLPWAWIELRLWPRAPLPYFAGLVLVYAGLAFAVWARMHLGRNWSGTVTVKEDHELIRSGPYALVRHPLYPGLLIAVLGTALASGTLRAALAFAIITAALLRKLRIEEAFMGATFPEECPRYRAAVPPLLPFTKLRRSAPR